MFSSLLKKTSLVSHQLKMTVNLGSLKNTPALILNQNRFFATHKKRPLKSDMMPADRESIMRHEQEVFGRRSDSFFVEKRFAEVENEIETSPKIKYEENEYKSVRPKGMNLMGSMMRDGGAEMYVPKFSGDISGLAGVGNSRRIPSMHQREKKKEKRRGWRTSSRSK